MSSAFHVHSQCKQTPLSSRATLRRKTQQAPPSRAPDRADVSRRKALQVDDQGFTLVQKDGGTATPRQHRHSSSVSSLRQQDSKQRRESLPRSKSNGKKNEADWKGNWREIEHDDLINGLNWQQASLLKSRRVSKDAVLPTRAPPVSATKSNKKRSKTEQATITLLPPLRFSSEPGKSAWRFVLPSPKPPQTDDLPKWCGPKTDDLIVTLGSRRSSTTPSAASSSSDSDTSASSSDEESELEQQACTQDLVSGMLQSLSIYAGPSFSAAAPQPCHLPFPSFLSRS